MGVYTPMTTSRKMIVGIGKQKKKRGLNIGLIKSEVKNGDTTLFGRLRRLFSTNVIVRNVGGKKLKIGVDTDQELKNK